MDDAFTHLFPGRQGASAEQAGRYRLVPARANGCPAFAVYQRDPSCGYAPVSLQVVSIRAGRIAEINTFLNDRPEFYRKFGLPSCL